MSLAHIHDSPKQLGAKCINAQKTTALDVCQKLINAIFDHEAENTDSYDFLKFSFYTHLSNLTYKAIGSIYDKNYDKCNQATLQRSKILSSDFFRDFNIVIAPLGHFPRLFYGDEYFGDILGVEFLGNESHDMYAWMNVSERLDNNHPMHLPPHITTSYDNLLNPIHIVEFCIFLDLLKGKFRNLSHSEKINAESYDTYCIVYHYAGCNELKVKSAEDAHFYKELMSYQYQVEFDEIDTGDEVKYYITENKKAFQMQHLSIIDTGKRSAWWESFKRSHSEICKKEYDYKSLKDETHILARCEYYDKNIITGRKELVILHQSSYPHYLMTKTSKLKTLIEP
ncbi:hypothetical protein [Bacteroides caecimuris]|uniref:hypothetical protein n=1 Tax=Bacteroides caecimuris TaxID=1796613 RepID=UPI0026E55839|nr:hypothetical protein [Bacteroides caecimuris]